MRVDEQPKNVAAAWNTQRMAQWIQPVVKKFLSGVAQGQCKQRKKKFASTASIRMARG
ncbi:hypothetical protein ACQYWY_09135 [Comamonas sediminis]|uniref:hypothetical protein n=1 Tax=Comamonas sediminis TaxID=1783360 RepID=UPI003D269679